MRNIIYDVAVSLDGFIAGPDGDISMFPHEGEHASDYQDRLAFYGTVVMGRNTYEFGYQYGLEPGARAYPHMDHHIFSATLDVPDKGDVTVIAKGWSSHLNALKRRDGKPIYLCGGGQFAGFVLKEGLINVLRLKRAPVILGRGTPLFTGASPKTMTLQTAKTHENGVIFEAYEVT